LRTGPIARKRTVYQAAFNPSLDEWFKSQQTIRVNVTGSNCPLKSLDFITLASRTRCATAFAPKPARGLMSTRRAPTWRIHAYLDATHCTLYLDTSGEPLYKRGLRGIE